MRKIRYKRYRITETRVFYVRAKSKVQARAFYVIPSRMSTKIERLK